MSTCSSRSKNLILVMHACLHVATAEGMHACLHVATLEGMQACLHVATAEGMQACLHVATLEGLGVEPTLRPSQSLSRVWLYLSARDLALARAQTRRST